MFSNIQKNVVFTLGWCISLVPVFLLVAVNAVVLSERYEVADAYFLTRRGFCSGAWNLSNHGSSACQTHHNIGGYVPISLVVTRVGTWYSWSRKQDCKAGGLFRVTIGTEEGTVDCTLVVECSGQISNITQRSVSGRLTPYVEDVAGLVLRPTNWMSMIHGVDVYEKDGKIIFAFLKAPRVLRRYTRLGRPLNIIRNSEEISLTFGRLNRSTKTVNVSYQGAVYRVEFPPQEEEHTTTTAATTSIIQQEEDYSAAGGIDPAVVSARSTSFWGDEAFFPNGKLMPGLLVKQGMTLLVDMQRMGLYRDGKVTVFADGDTTRASFYLSGDDSIWRPAPETYMRNGKRRPLYSSFPYFPPVPAVNRSFPPTSKSYLLRSFEPSKFEMTLRLEKLNAEGRMKVALSGAREAVYEFTYDNRNTGHVREVREIRMRRFARTPHETVGVQRRLEDILKNCEKMVFDDEGRVTFSAARGRGMILFDPVVNRAARSRAATSTAATSRAATSRAGDIRQQGQMVDH